MDPALAAKLPPGIPPNIREWLLTIDINDPKYDYVTHNSHWLTSKYDPTCEKCRAATNKSVSEGPKQISGIRQNFGATLQKPKQFSSDTIIKKPSSFLKSQPAPPPPLPPVPQTVQTSQPTNSTSEQPQTCGETTNGEVIQHVAASNNRNSNGDSNGPQIAVLNDRTPLKPTLAARFNEAQQASSKANDTFTPSPQYTSKIPHPSFTSTTSKQHPAPHSIDTIIPITPIAPSNVSRVFVTPKTSFKYNDTFTRSTRASTKKLLKQAEDLIDLNETYELYKSALAE